MSSTYIKAELRRLVRERALGICEYCLIAESDTFLGCQVDHIISEKHGGATEAVNLSFACVGCNQAKGSDVGSVYWETGEFVRFFNPRTDRWLDNFAFAFNQIQGNTPNGAVTARVLAFNTDERLSERATLIAGRRYPSAAAVALLQV
jgi:hypothetical protein